MYADSSVLAVDGPSLTAYIILRYSGRFWRTSLRPCIVPCSRIPLDSSFESQNAFTRPSVVAHPRARKDIRT